MTEPTHDGPTADGHASTLGRNADRTRTGCALRTRRTKEREELSGLSFDQSSECRRVAGPGILDSGPGSEVTLIQNRVFPPARCPTTPCTRRSNSRLQTSAPRQAKLEVIGQRSSQHPHLGILAPAAPAAPATRSKRCQPFRNCFRKLA